jgi:hypothetical protein
MRRLVLTCLLVSALIPAAALAAPALVGDGSLAVRNAGGDGKEPVVTILITGAVVGQVERGRVQIEDPSTADGPAPVVKGAEKQRDVSGTTKVYSGNDISFRAVGGRSRIRIWGTGISVNAIGQGLVRLVGSSTLAPTAWYAVNGGARNALPDTGLSFVLVGS